MPGLGEGEELVVNGDRVQFCEMKIFWRWLWWWLNNNVNVLTTELYAKRWLQ